MMPVLTSRPPTTPLSRSPATPHSHMVGVRAVVAEQELTHNTRRFTLTGHEPLEAGLLATCEKVAEGLRTIVPGRLIEGLVLAGGYGRGEGGVLMTPGGERPYNDLEFYLFLKGRPLLLDRKYKAAIDAMSSHLSDAAGLDVEIKIESLQRLRRSPVTMFSYDLCVKHRCIIGGDELFRGCEHHLDPRGIPLHEATRLLFNRCSGLLYAAERLAHRDFTADDSDFVIRNHAKLQMAMGDALLAAVGHYHWSCRERGHRMSELLADWEMAAPVWVHGLKSLTEVLFRHHSEGIAFKLHPHRDQMAKNSREELLRRQGLLKWVAGQVWLALESMRLGHSFANAKAYALSPVNKCPEKPAWRNVLINSRSQLWDPRYPRQRLFHALNILLWGDVSKLEQLACVQRELRTTATSLDELVAAYEALWVRFN